MRRLIWLLFSSNFVLFGQQVFSILHAVCVGDCRYVFQPARLQHSLSQLPLPHRFSQQHIQKDK